jgi:hypothetical protein
MQVRDRLVPVVCVIAPVLSYILSAHSKEWLGGYVFSFEILIVNGLFTFIGLWLISRPGNEKIGKVIPHDAK